MSYSIRPVGDYVTLRQGLAINKGTKHYVSSKVTDLPLLKIADMQTGNFGTYIDETVPDSFRAKPNDLIYTRTGRVGLVFRGQAGVVHNNCFVVSPIDEKQIDRDYLFFVMQDARFREAANVLASGAAQADLSHPKFKSIPIAIPPINEQKAIAAILMTYDNLIENNRRQIALLEEAAQRLYREWFVDLRFPGHESIEFVDGMPVGWACKTIGTLLGKIESGSRPSGGIDKALKEGVPSIGAENVIGLGKYNFSSEKLVSHEFFNEMNRGVLHDRDILVYKDGAYTGRVSFTQDGFPHSLAAVNEHVFLVHAADEDYQYWLYFTLAQQNYYQMMQTLSVNSAQPGINQQAFKSLEATVPSVQIAGLFGEKVEPLLKRLFSLAKMNRVLSVARDCLLPKLMSGEITV